MSFDAFVHLLTRSAEVAGIAVLVLGALLSTAVFLREWRAVGLSDAYHRYRANLGRAILLGLEILIVADIIGTIAIEPTAQNLAALGLIVLIRTFLSFALEVEISGRLPWRRGSEDAPHEPPNAD